MFKESKIDRLKKALRNFWINLKDRGFFEAIQIFYSNFFKSKTHKFETQTPYGDWQCIGERIRYVVNTGFLDFVENHAYPRWSDYDGSGEVNPSEVIKEFDNQIDHYKKNNMSGKHILAVKEAREAYRILRMEIPELEEKKEKSSGWEEWGDYDDEIIQKKYEAARIISDHLDWMWI